jgi:hypothetical protein
LGEADQYLLLQSIRCSRVVNILADLVRHPRGPARPFMLSEMAVGRRVKLTDENDLPSDDPGIGTIVSWTTDACGLELDLVSVRWPDGSVCEYVPLEACLWRVD